MKIAEFVKNKENAVSGVYAIICDKTWRSYVGSAVNIHRRIKIHLANLRHNHHVNNELQKHFDQYLKESFFVEILEKCADKELLKIENIWKNKGCNLYNQIAQNYPIIMNVKQMNKFWNQVEKKDRDQCWNWTGYLDKDGYGRMGITNKYGIKYYRSNRIAYFLNFGDNDIYTIIRHKCNNKKCCNPNHLIKGSNKDNKKDCIESGINTKLNWEYVKIIRNKFQENPSIKRIHFKNWFLETYNIDLPYSYLIDIAKNKAWPDNNY